MATDTDREISRLRDLIDSKQHDMMRAAEIGKALLDDKIKLEAEIERIRKKHSEEIGNLKQELHSAHLRATALEHAQADYIQEIDALKDLISTRNDAFNQLNEVSSRLRQLTTAHSDLQLDYKHLQENTTAIEKKLGSAEEEIAQLRAQLAEKTASALNASANASGVSENEIAQLRDELYQAVKEVESKQCTITSLQRKVDDLEMRYSQLEECKQACEEELAFSMNRGRLLAEENTNLKEEIEVIKMQQFDEKKKGNSVFAEVEDRRMAVEKKMIKMKIELESLKERDKRRVRDLQRTYSHCAMLMASRRSEADARYINSLEMELARVREDLSLVQCARNSIKNTATITGDDALQRLLKIEKERVKMLEQEMNRMRALKCVQVDEHQSTRKALHRAERQVEELQADVLELKIRLHERIHSGGVTEDPPSESNKATTCVEKIPEALLEIESRGKLDAVESVDPDTLIQEAVIKTEEEGKENVTQVEDTQEREKGEKPRQDGDGVKVRFNVDHVNNDDDNDNKKKKFESKKGKSKTIVANIQRLSDPPKQQECKQQ